MDTIMPHGHNDTDSPKLYAGDALVGAPQEALTTGTLSTAVAATELSVARIALK